MSKEDITNSRNAFNFWYFAAELVKTAIWVSVILYLLHSFVVQPFIIQGDSMKPNLNSHSYVLVNKLIYRFNTPRRGEVIIFQNPLDLSTDFAKRIIGLPNETITIENNKIYVNGKKLDEPYLSENIQTKLPSGILKKTYVIPSNQYFVLGDNRDNSNDSRDFGPIQLDTIVGRVGITAY